MPCAGGRGCVDEGQSNASTHPIPSPAQQRSYTTTSPRILHAHSCAIHLHGGFQARRRQLLAENGAGAPAARKRDAMQQLRSSTGARTRQGWGGDGGSQQAMVSWPALVTVVTVANVGDARCRPAHFRAL